VRTLGIVFLLPDRTQHPGLSRVLDLLAVQDLVAELAVERVDSA
jgi:hypothetical protein